jgi:RHS repeat-associated protein
MTSVCEMSTATGSGMCNQSTTQTGFWTKYTYDALGDLLTVTQNAQAASGSQQTRSYLYDGMGRRTSEANPESGTTSYAYDVDGGCGASLGDLTKRTDALGIVTCFGHDVLHRVTSTKFSNSTNCRFYFYDSNSGLGFTEANIKGRLADAYIGNCNTGAPTTSYQGFNYSPRGELVNLYQYSAPGGIWYNSVASYWPNGGLNTLQLFACVSNCNTNQVTATPLITYNSDGEGRPSTVSASAGQNPVTATTYNAANLPTAVTFGSSDTDALTYDAQSFRMTKYQFNVNGQAYVGALTWNANGSLGSQVITDPFNSADNQTCTYAQDDLVRIAKADCSAAWQQTFAYDAFGNIVKNVPTGGTGMSFQAQYSTSTNRITSVLGFVPTYDADGNVLTDTNHTYTWDANGNSITVDGVGLTFDAFDRMIEQNRSGTYTDVVYSPTGQKFALMNGTTLKKAFIPLTGTATAVYTSAGLDHYRHGDWLGSARLAASPTRTVLSTVAYAPFGETYASSGTPDLSFTGDNPDTTGNEYDFLYRQYSNQGRWASPDPAGLAAVNPTSPQSWNRYSYVVNNALGFTDPMGLNPLDDPCHFATTSCIQQIQAKINGLVRNGCLDPNLDPTMAILGVCSPAFAGLDEFDLLLKAFTSTGPVENPICYDCANPIIPGYNNFWLAGLLGRLPPGASGLAQYLKQQAARPQRPTAPANLRQMFEPVQQINVESDFWKLSNTGKITWTLGKIVKFFDATSTDLMIMINPSPCGLPSISPSQGPPCA